MLQCSRVRGDDPRQMMPSLRAWCSPHTRTILSRSLGTVTTKVVLPHTRDFPIVLSKVHAAGVECHHTRTHPPANIGMAQDKLLPPHTRDDPTSDLSQQGALVSAPHTRTHPTTSGTRTQRFRSAPVSAGMTDYDVVCIRAREDVSCRAAAVMLPACVLQLMGTPARVLPHARGYFRHATDMTGWCSHTRGYFDGRDNGVGSTQLVLPCAG